MSEDRPVICTVRLELWLVQHRYIMENTRRLAMTNATVCTVTFERVLKVACS